MDISNLDCPQYVKFPIEEFELLYSMEDSLNIEKHEDSSSELTVPNDEEESYIFIDDSSHTENSILDDEEYIDKSLTCSNEVTSVQVQKDEKQSDISDQFVSAIGSSLGENSCTEKDTIVHVKSEDHSEHIKDNNIQKDVFEHLDCMIDSVFTPISYAGSEAFSEHDEAENIQSDVFSHLNSMVDSVSEVSCKGSRADSESINNENTLSFVSSQSDYSVYVDAEASYQTKNALLVHIKSEDHSKDVENNIQNEVFDHLDCMVDCVSTTICGAGFEAHSEHVREEKVQSEIPEQCDSMVDIVSEAVSCEGSGIDSEPINNESTLNSTFGGNDCSVNLDAGESSKAESSLSVHIKSEDHSEHVKDNLQSDVLDHLDSIVDSVSQTISSAGFEAQSEHATDEKLQNKVPEQCDNMVDIVSEAVSCEGSVADSEHINNEKALNYVLGQSDCVVALDAEESSNQENSIESEVQTSRVEDENLQSDMVDDFDIMVDLASEAISCLGCGPDSEPVNNENLSSRSYFDQSDSGVDLESETSSYAVNASAAHFESEALSEHVQDEITENQVFSPLDELVSTESSCAGDDILVCDISEVRSEHVNDNNLQSGVFDHLDCEVDFVSTAFSCAGAEVNSENVRDEKMVSLPDQENGMIDLLSEVGCDAEDGILVCDNFENDPDLKDTCDEIVQREDMEEFCSAMGSENVEAMTVAEVHINFENDPDLKDTCDGIVQNKDMEEFCTAIDSENVEATTVAEANINSKDFESMETSKSTAQKNQVCDISKVYSGSKGAISKTKQDVYIPLAQQVAAFQQKCPERYLSSHGKNFQTTKNWAPPKYVPKSPKLQAAKRHREIKTNIEDAKRYEFHARPLNPKIFEKPKTLETEKQSTQPKGFSLKTAQRAEAHVKSENSDAKKNEFHARPVPKSCHLKQNEPEKMKMHATKPKSPNFALKNREEKWSQRSTKTNDDTKPSHHKICPKPPKQVELSQSVLKQEKKPIEILPFSFEEREKARMALKQQKSQDLGKENQKPGFKAREMPSFKPPALPSIQRKPITQPAPFTFLSESRISSQKGDTTIANKTGFKTHSDSVLKTFNPKKVLSLAEAREFQLHTEKRAKEWKQMEEIRKAEEMEKQKALEAYKAAKESQEQREIMRMRQNAVHKANPIRAYKNVEIKPCNLVTQPFTPKFETDKRLQSRLEKTEIHF